MITAPQRELRDYISDVSKQADIRAGSPLLLGTQECDGGVNFAIFSRCASRVRLELFAIGLCLGCRSKVTSPIPEAEYATKIIGHWRGMLGDLKESMSINGDGTFVCTLRPRGFIANTLSQAVTGTIRGTWKLTGAVITLKITSAENEHLKNTTTSSTIVAFMGDELVLKSDRGETSSFHREIAL